jgi:hypothetical protein
VDTFLRDGAYIISLSVYQNVKVLVMNNLCAHRIEFTC